MFCIVLYEIKMENQKKKKNLSNREIFVWNLQKNILFAIENRAEFRPQNRVIKSPESTYLLHMSLHFKWCIKLFIALFTLCQVTEVNIMLLRVLTKKLFSYFSTKPYVVGTQKNRLNEAVLLSTHNIC